MKGLHGFKMRLEEKVLNLVHLFMLKIGSFLDWNFSRLLFILSFTIGFHCCTLKSNLEITYNALITTYDFIPQFA